MLAQRGVGVLEIVLAPHAEGDVPEAPQAGRLLLRRLEVLGLEEIDAMALALERHERAAVRRIFLQDVEAEDFGIELLGPFEIEHPHEDVAELLQSHHHGLP